VSDTPDDTVRQQPADAVARFDTLLEATADAIVGVDGTGRIVFANTRCEQLFGYSPHMLTGMKAHILFSAGAQNTGIELLRELVQHPELRNSHGRVTTGHRRRDGSEFTAEVTLSWLDRPGGLLVIAAIRDLTPLRRAESRFQALLEAAPDAIIGVSRDARIVLMNVAAERLLGYTREELLGRSYESIIPLPFRDAIGGEVARAFAAPDTSRAVQTDVLCRDGRLIPTESVVTRFDDGPEQILLSSIRDMRAWRIAEAERQRLAEEVERQRTAQIVERAQRVEALGQLAGGVAHDFNNLLAVIINYASLVAGEISDPEGDEPHRWASLRSDVDRIQRAAEGGASLTRQLLAFGRREVSRPRVLSISTTVKDMEHLLQTSVGGRVSLRVNVRDDLWPVWLDSGQLEQVLVNLCVNARDAMPSGGNIVIETDNTVLSEDNGEPVAPGRYVRIRVTDTGGGMPPEVVKRAFEPFYTTKPKESGTGLGLAVVHGIITQAGGHVRIDSTMGHGTCVSVLFPATDKALADVESGAALVRPRHDETVLLVEDEDGIRDAAARVLTRQGYEVLVAANGPAALDLAHLNADRIDLLLTDVIMPGMAGRELADRVATLIPELCVIFMSGYDQPLLTPGGEIDAGAILLEKPFNPGVLLDTLEAALANA
jgi:PAS domain S-box-containing protein